MALNSLLASGVKWRTRSIYIFLGMIALGFLLLRDFFIIKSPISWEMSSNAQQNVSITLMLLSTLWALEFIVSSRDEIVRPVRNVFPAMVLTMGAVAVLGFLSTSLIQASVGMESIPKAPLLIVTEGGNQTYQGLFLFTYTAAGLGLNLLALNRGYVQVVHLFEAMRQDGFLPERLMMANILGRVPLMQIGIPTLIAVAVMAIGDMKLAAGLTAFAFLWMAAFAHLPTAFRSQSGLPNNRRPKLPFHPLFSWIVIAMGLFLPFAMRYHLWLWGAGWMAAGIVYYVLYARPRAIAVRRKTDVVADEEDELSRQHQSDDRPNL